MKQSDFDVMVDETLASCRDLLCVKGGEYAGSEDRLANFKRGAIDTGCTPMQVLWIYLSKHLDSIKTYIKDDAHHAHRPRSEAIQGRIDDAINYLMLFKGLVVEKEEQVRVAPGGVPCAPKLEPSIPARIVAAVGEGHRVGDW